MREIPQRKPRDRYSEGSFVIIGDKEIDDLMAGKNAEVDVSQFPQFRSHDIIPGDIIKVCTAYKGQTRIYIKAMVVENKSSRAVLRKVEIVDKGVADESYKNKVYLGSMLISPEHEVESYMQGKETWVDTTQSSMFNQGKIEVGDKIQAHVGFYYPGVTLTRTEARVLEIKSGRALLKKIG